MSLVQPEGSVAYLTNSFTLASLMPKNMDLFYTYRGSLTTPPCSEVVTWIVFPDPLTVSISQIVKFRQLSNRNGYLSDNFRKIQHRGHRRIFVRRFPTVVTTYRNIYRNVSSPLFWGLLLNSV
uniref:Alpha-carbonic anhydrase domain-containing protein n=2 Tax=Rhodnius prolixus TaxID=13249 RepID=T1HZT9_RHOPR